MGELIKHRVVTMPTWHQKLTTWSESFDLTGEEGRVAFRKLVLAETAQTPISTLRMVAYDSGVPDVPAARRAVLTVLVKAWITRATEADMACSCDPTRGQACPACDGTEAEQAWRPGDSDDETLPPCMLVAERGVA